MLRLFLLVYILASVAFASEDLLQADRLFQATLFEEAKSCYEALLKQNNDDSIRGRLVEIYFLLKMDREAIKIAEGIEFSGRPLYFKALALSRLGMYQEAILALTRYQGEYSDEAKMELAKIYTIQNQLQLAIPLYESISSPLAKLNLAHLLIKQGELQRSLQVLNSLDLEDPKHAFLMGVTLMRLSQPSEAIHWLEKGEGAEARYHLGWAYLIEKSYQKSEETFQGLLKESEYKDKALLALAQVYLSQSEPQKAELLLRENPSLASAEAEAEMLFFKAQATASEQLYKALTEGPYQNTPIYAEGWFERGLNAFKEGNFSIAREAFNQAFKLLKDERRKATALYMSGQILYQKNRAEAEKLFLQLIQEYPTSSLVPDSLLFAAKCTEGERAREYRRQVFERFPSAPSAAEAYFTFYPYRDYVQGERSAIKHLQAMAAQFPKAPELITAYYLIGMDEMRDRKTAQGKWLRKKNLMEAIKAFHEAETLFGELLPKEDFYIQVRERAILERALANFKIAEESQGAKQRIFNQYAAEVFEQLRRELKNRELLDECSYWLAQVYLKMDEEQKAETLLVEMAKRIGYYPSRAHYELGNMAMRRGNFQKALSHFSEIAESSLSADQKIDLWIQKSMVFRKVGDLNQAMLILSDAINDPCISSLRVKAMYLRAELYELQGRHDLARKQLEATAKKGGEWALKAKQYMFTTPYPLLGERDRQIGQIPEEAIAEELLPTREAGQVDCRSLLEEGGGW